MVINMDGMFFVIGGVLMGGAMAGVFSAICTLSSIAVIALLAMGTLTGVTCAAMNVGE